MSTIVPPSEKLRRALRHIADERSARPERSLRKLIEDAAFRFDLSPGEQEWLTFTLERPA